MTSKNRVREITITLSESAHLDDGKTYASFAEVNVALRRAVTEAPDTGAYHKTGFRLVYEDGYTYEGRIDLVRSMGGDVLGEHVRGFNLSRSGQKKPAHMTQERYEEMLDAYDASARTLDPEEPRSGRQVSADFLAGYQIGETDETEARAAVTSELPVVTVEGPKAPSIFEVLAYVQGTRAIPAGLDEVEEIHARGLREKLALLEVLDLDVLNAATRISNLPEGRRAKIVSGLLALLDMAGA